MVKTITIKEDAYEKLKGMKMGDESFSDVINRIGSTKKDIKSLFGIMKDIDIKSVKKRIKEFREEATKDMGKRINDLTRQLSNSRNTQRH